MEFMSQLMPIIVYILLAVLLIVLIILVIKLLSTVDKTNAVLDDIEEKSRSLNGVFGAIDSITDTISMASDKLIDGIAAIVGKVVNRRRKTKKGGEDYE